MQEHDVSFVTGPGDVVNIEVIDRFLYVSIIGSEQMTHLRIDSSFQATPLTGLPGIAFDLQEHDGILYAVGTDSSYSYVAGSENGVDFTTLLKFSDPRFGPMPGNLERQPSLASFQGKLHLGSSTNGNLYRLE